MQSKRQ